MPASTNGRTAQQQPTDLVANVSHEMRTPIAAIKGFAETLLRGGLNDETRRVRFVKTIEEHADRLKELVEDLLTLSALENNLKEAGRQRPEPISLDEAIQLTVRELRALAKRRKVSMRVRMTRGLKVLLSPCQLRQVLQNLIGNGIKYNHKGGSIVVSAQSAGGKARIMVSDTGIGVEPEERGLIFNRFHRTPRARRLGNGSGLGLCIVRLIAENHGGKAWLERSSDAGSTFICTLPLASRAR